MAKAGLGKMRPGGRMLKERRPADFRLRPAKPGDYRFAIALYLDSAKRHLSRIRRWNERRLRIKFRNGYKQAQTQIICVGEKAVGWIQVAEQVGRLNLLQLHLIPAYQGRGIGTCLIKDLLQRADALSKPVALMVMHGNPARVLYVRLSFRQTGCDVDRIQMIRHPQRGSTSDEPGRQARSAHASPRPIPCPASADVSGCAGSRR